MPMDLRRAVDDALRDRDEALALARLDELLREAPSIANAKFVSGRVRSIGCGKPRVGLRVALLRSYTLEPVVPLLEAAAILHGLELEIWLGGFNTYEQEIVDAGSDLYRFAPDVALLAVQASDLVPGASSETHEVAERIRTWVEAFRSGTSSHLVIQNLEVPDAPQLGILDAQSLRGQRSLIQEINRQIVLVADEANGVYVLDYDGLVARHGKRRWRDERKWLTARMPVSAEFLMPLAQEYLRFLLPLAGIGARVLAVDLDNTLWGGVVAEDGTDGISVGSEYPGTAYQNLQRALMSVRSRGVLLAVCSKNDAAEAVEAMNTHPGMLLRSTDFAASRIGWKEKYQSLREIAAELNVGLDSIAFLDDSPVEREAVRLALPEVTVIELPSDPLGHAQAVLDCPLFERLSLTAEDGRRAELYQQETRRSELRRGSRSIEGFLRSLEIEVDIGRMSAAGLARVAQLTQKTNQFNLTTRRFSEPELVEIARDPLNRIYQASVRDRFGDSGIVGVAITHQTEDAWEIEAFLLSCRVLGRTVEVAMLASVAEEARQTGATSLRGWFLATKKNHPASGFYGANGFTAVRSGDGATLWELDLREKGPACPDWITSRRLDT